MLKPHTFKVTKQITIGLPMVLVCKKTGYLDTINSNSDLGKQFCQIGRMYSLVEIRETDDPGDPTFIMRTESWDSNDEMYTADHLMDYEFMAEYFFVTF